MINLDSQKEVKQNLKTILSNFKDSNAEIRAHCLIAGDTGTGKTYLIKELAKELELPVIMINSASLTIEGVSGNSVSKALSPLSLGSYKNMPTVVILDEFDKPFLKQLSNTEAAHSIGIQSELLKFLENSEAQVFGNYGKYETIKTDKLLFIFSGVFDGENTSEEYYTSIGLQKEFLGRISIYFNFKSLTEKDLRKLLNEHPLLDSYCKLYKADKKETIKKLRKLISLKFGARGIEKIIHRYFIDFKKQNINLEKKEMQCKTL